MLLLTGATGLAGSFIADAFARRREPVRALVRNRAKAQRLQAAASIDLVYGDMSDRDSLWPALDGVDRVLMISGPDEQMVEKQCGFIDACRAAGVRHVVKLSGLDARSDSPFRFGPMHRQIEEHLERSGLAWTHLRPSGFMQVYLREAASIISDGAIYHALGATKLCPVDLVDVAQVGFLLLRHGDYQGERLNMTGPEALSMADMASRISKAIHKPVRYVDVAPAERHRLLLARGVTPWFADALDEQIVLRLQGGAESRVDLSTHRLFLIRPSTFAEFADRHAADFGKTRG